MKFKYQDKIVAFIDVLGFSEIVYSKTTHSISTYFDIILNGFYEAAAKNHLKFTLISDSIVISAKHDNYNFKLLIKVLCRLQSKLLNKGILLRGAISFGELYLNKSNNILVGSGLINAYKLESLAIYPRIIVDRRFIKQYYEGTSALIVDTSYGLNELLIFKPPIPYLADFPYINYTEIYGFSNSTKEFREVIQFLKDNYYKNEFIIKYEWLKRHLLMSAKHRLDMFNEQTLITKRTRERIRANENFINDLRKL